MPDGGRCSDPWPDTEPSSGSPVQEGLEGFYEPGVGQDHDEETHRDSWSELVRIHRLWADNWKVSMGWTWALSVWWQLCCLVFCGALGRRTEACL